MSLANVGFDVAAASVADRLIDAAVLIVGCRTASFAGRPATPRVPVMRRDCRVFCVLGCPLVRVALAGFIVLRTQGSRIAQDAKSHESHLPDSAGERPFDKVQDREPLAETDEHGALRLHHGCRPATRRPRL